jgi:glycosyltransferase involved in cell wall biosynthesis
MKPVILVFVDWYLPGYKAGGLITAVANLVHFIGDRFQLFVFTRDRDLTDKNAYTGVRRDEWTSVGKARVVYSDDLSIGQLRRRILELLPNVIYLNSFFSTLTIKSLCLRQARLIPACAIVLAPRGEFSPGALRIKAWRKAAFVACALRLGLYRDVIWQASSELERGHIASQLRAARFVNPAIHIAWDLPSQNWLQAANESPKPAKRSGTRFLFISRVSRKKNLLFALDVLCALMGRVEFDILGPLDDPGYWKECQRKIEFLPGNVIVRYRGTIPREDVPKVASEYHFFLLPTQGENFGFAILEAMAASCPVIVSDRTPWREATDGGAGWSLPLEDRDLWRRVLQQCVDMDQAEYAEMSRRARDFVEAWAQSHNRQDETMQLFNLALECGSAPGHRTGLADTARNAAP